MHNTDKHCFNIKMLQNKNTFKCIKMIYFCAMLNYNMDSS